MPNDVQATPDEIKSLFGNAAQSVPASNTTRNTVASTGSVAIAPVPEGIEQYARPGVFLDTVTGAPVSTRAGLSFADSPEAKTTYLQAAYKDSTVDQTKDGNFIIRNVLDQKTGETKDLLLNPKGIDAGDFADFTHAGLRTLAEAIAIPTVIGNIPKLAALKGFADVAVKSGIGSLTGNALDTATRTLIGGEPFNLSERVKGTLSDAASGAVLGGLLEGSAKAVNATLGTLSNELAPGATESVGIQGIKGLEQDTGIAIQPTLGQMSADPSMGRLEAFTAKLPYFGEALRKQLEVQQANIRQLQRTVIDSLTGGKPVQPLSELGADMVDVVKQSVRSGQAEQNVASATMVSRASNELVDALDSIAPAARSFTTETTADLTKGAAQAQNKEFRDMAGQLFETAGDPSISTEPLKKMVAEVEAGLPHKSVINENDLPNVVKFPGAKATTTGESVPVPELIPSELSRFIKGINSLDSSMPLSELRRVRGTVDSAITEGRGLEGVSTYELKKIQHALTETISQGAKNLGPEGDKILRANAFYKENIERFEVPFIARLLKNDPSSPGYLRSFDLINQIRSTPDTFRDVQNFLRSGVREGGQLVGATADDTFNALRRGLLEGILARARVSPGGVGKSIDADAFLRELNQFEPEVRSAITGVQADTLAKNLDLLKQIKGGFKEVPADGLEAFLRFPNNNLQDLSKLASAVKKEKELFKNEVVQKLFKGDAIDLDHVQADQALSYLMDAKNVGDVQKFMSLMSGHPEVVQQMQANAVAQLFQRVAQATKPAEAAHLNDLSQIVSAPKLIDALKDQGTREKLQSIIGNSSFNILENFAKSMAVLGKEGSGSLVGSATATSTLIHMSRLLTDWPMTAKFALYSKVLTNRGLQRAVMDASLTPGMDVKRFTTALIASQPIVEALTKEFGKTGTQLLVQMTTDYLNTQQNLLSNPRQVLQGKPTVQPMQSNRTNTNDLKALFKR